MEEMKAQAEHVGTRMMWDTIVEVDFDNGSPFRAVGDSGDEYIADTVVIATGAQAKWLGVPGEQELGGKDRSRAGGIIIRGDLDVEDAKLQKACGALSIRPAQEEEILACYRRVRDQIRQWVETLPGGLEKR